MLLLLVLLLLPSAHPELGPDLSQTGQDRTRQDSRSVQTVRHNPGARAGERSWVDAHKSLFKGQGPGLVNVQRAKRIGHSFRRSRTISNAGSCFFSKLCAVKLLRLRTRLLLQPFLRRRWLPAARREATLHVLAGRRATPPLGKQQKTCACDTCWA